MQQQTFIASGRIVMDNFHERFFLFVAEAMQITVDGRTVSAGSLPETEREFIQRLLDLSLDGQAIPAGFSATPAEFSSFRIIRLIGESFEIVPAEIQAALGHSGDSSREVTLSGHVATDEEMSLHDRLTNPTITLEKVVPFETIQQQAFEMFQSATSGSATDNWLRAERKLLTQ